MPASVKAKCPTQLTVAVVVTIALCMMWYDLLQSLCLKKNHWWSRMSKLEMVAGTAMYVACL
jgi:hypothetical protein